MVKIFSAKLSIGEKIMIFSELKKYTDPILLVKLTKLTNKISAFSSFQLSKVCCFEIQF